MPRIIFILFVSLSTRLMGQNGIIHVPGLNQMYLVQSADFENLVVFVCPPEDVKVSYLAISIKGDGDSTYMAAGMKDSAAIYSFKFVTPEVLDTAMLTYTAKVDFFNGKGKLKYSSEYKIRRCLGIVDFSNKFLLDTVVAVRSHLPVAFYYPPYGRDCFIDDLPRGQFSLSYNGEKILDRAFGRNYPALINLSKHPIGFYTVVFEDRSVVLELR